MHFLAMLSMRFPVPIHYDLLQTLGSGLIAVLVVGFALLLLHFRQRTQSILNTAGLCLGVGIVVMHIVGMLGMRGVIPGFNLGALAVASVLAFVMGIAAIRVSYGSRSRLNIVKGGVMFGLAVVVVHYTAMMGMHFSVDPDYQELTTALNQGSLAIAVTVAGFVICGTFLLAASTFVPAPAPASAPEHVAGGTAEPMVANTDRSSGTPVKSEPTGTGRPTSERLPEHEKLNTSAHDSAKTVLEPATERPRNVPKEAQQAGEQTAEKATDRAGAKIQAGAHTGAQAGDQAAYQVASPEELHNQVPAPELQRAAHASAGPTEPLLPVKIPYEQQKQILFVDSSEVGAIRADGRYTQLYTRDGVKFCPWSITEAEKRLVGTRFYRSHRSYLINITAVAGFEKNRDSGVCRFEGFTHLTNVPVSRARVNELVAELGL